jgi:transcriptional regulator of met regulon
MSTIELSKRLIDKIRKTDNEDLLAEANRLLELETKDIEIYKLNNDQKKAITKARQQIKSGQFLTTEQTNKEIDSLKNQLKSSLIFHKSEK